MKQLNYTKGKLGEQIAIEYLKKKGYSVIKSNYRTRFGELDIIASKNNLLVFVEVKLKTGENFGTPEEMITTGKLWQIRQTAEAFLMQEKAFRDQYKQYRIDTVCITMQDNLAPKVRHYENIGSEI